MNSYFKDNIIKHRLFGIYSLKNLNCLQRCGKMNIHSWTSVIWELMRRSNGTFFVSLFSAIRLYGREWNVTSAFPQMVSLLWQGCCLFNKQWCQTIKNKWLGRCSMNRQSYPTMKIKWLGVSRIDSQAMLIWSKTEVNGCIK